MFSQVWIAPRAAFLIGLFGACTIMTFLLVSDVARARQQPLRNESGYRCARIEEPITIDGQADEKAWQRSFAIDSFRVLQLDGSSRPAKAKTEARLLWDREYLYLFAEIEDSTIFAAAEADASKKSSDTVSMILKPSANHDGYFTFQFDAAGKSRSVFHPRRGESEKPLGDFKVEAVVKRNGNLNQSDGQDRGWSVEARIPWVDFLRAGGRPEAGELWQIALWRDDADKDGRLIERSMLPPVTGKLVADPDSNENLSNLIFQDLDAEATRVPFGIAEPIAVTTSRVVGSPDPPLPYRLKRVFPSYSPSFPIMIKPIPGSDQLLVITEKSPYAPTSLVRIKNDPSAQNADEIKIMDTAGVAYDIAFDPAFTENSFVYVGWNGQNAEKKGPHTQITRFTMNPKPPYTLDLASAKTIIEWPSNGHNGGAICFGLDGMMYVTSGDGTADSDGNLMGQRTDSLLAKVLRIDVRKGDSNTNYSVPSDNPFVQDARFKPETWAYGLRNPWRITCDAKTGNIWVGNNGQDHWEQIYFVRRGENYGWSVMEGGHVFYANRAKGPTPISPPAIDHPHAEARSLTGGVVYHGQALPDLVGHYIYGDYSTGRIWAARHDGNKLVSHRELARTNLKITGFALDHRGELMICDHQASGQSGFYTLEPAKQIDRSAEFPRKLSETGLFQPGPGHRVVPGVIPYSVNAPFWSDGMYKERYIVLPPSGRIGYTQSRGWNFPDQTVIIKSFAVEEESGNPASRKWIETRLMTRQIGEWYGYSYVWRDDQSDADLVEANGMDRDFTIRVPQGENNNFGTRTQRWHYPSRVECMVCHTRAANYVLGLCELQMNKEHDYPSGVRDNQLRVLEHLGALEYDWVDPARRVLQERAKSAGLNEKQTEEYLKAMSPQAKQRPTKYSKLFMKQPDRSAALVNPADATQDLTLRARSWIHTNCSSCHVEAGGGNARMELDFRTSLEGMRVIDAVPLHQTFDLPDAKLIAPGEPDRSVLLYRAATRGPNQMPPLSSSVVDAEGVKLLREWIKSLKK